MKIEIIGSSKDSERNDECSVVHFFCVSEDTFSSTLILLVGTYLYQFYIDKCLEFKLQKGDFW